MKKCNDALLTGAAIGAGVSLALLWLIKPGRSTKAQRAPFRGQNFAHRGLYNKEAGIPENSLAAFRAAAAKGYGVELDVRLSADGFVVISHDNELLRMTGENKRVDRCTLAELRQLRLDGTEETIPLFSEVMDVLMAAHVPVIVEVKPVELRDELCTKTLEILDRYDGDCCVESFDPYTVRWFRKNAPDILRGQLTSQFDDLGKTPGCFLVSRVLTNFLCRPQFIAHHVGRKALTVRLCEAMGAMRVRWTAHDRAWENESDAVIFEHFEPPVHYK